MHCMHTNVNAPDLLAHFSMPKLCNQNYVSVKLPQEVWDSLRTLNPELVSPYHGATLGREATQGEAMHCRQPARAPAEWQQAIQSRESCIPIQIERRSVCRNHRVLHGRYKKKGRVSSLKPTHQLHLKSASSLFSQQTLCPPPTTPGIVLFGISVESTPLGMSEERSPRMQ